MFVTVESPRNHYQITFDDILNCTYGAEGLPYKKSKSFTVTHQVNQRPLKPFEKACIFRLCNIIMRFNEKHANLLPVKSEDYHEFKIQKKSGGWRTISEPKAELKAAQYELSSILKNEFKSLHHTSAYAYVEGRSTYDALKVHQYKESNWYLHTDFANFFGSITLEFTMHMLGMISPYCYLIEYGYTEELKKALSLCFLNNGLPQGTPISPLLTNIIMVPIDHEIANGPYVNMAYTRYADDIILSGIKDFDYKKTVEYINGLCEKYEAPFRVKPEKTHYGSRAGRNWNLGLMINKDNQITIGHERKKEFKAMLTNYIMDRKMQVFDMEFEEVMRMIGLINYYKMVEKDYIEYVIHKYSKKFDFDVMKAIRAESAGKVFG